MNSEEAVSHPGHQALLRHLRQRENDEPLIRAQVAGTVVFDLFVQLLRDESGRVRIEDLVAALASLGGHLCVVSVLETINEKRMAPTQVGMLEVEAREGIATTSATNRTGFYSRAVRRS
jgi:hypothetical protein